jgi:anti-sigma factor ChrR (cupin superfamily)
MTDDELARGYVIGTLDAAARSRLHTRMIEDATFKSLVADWDLRLIPLVMSGAQSVPATLYANIESRLSTSQVELPGTITRRHGSGEWIDMSPGLKIKVMHEIPRLKRFTFMAWLQPNAEYADHDHEQDEEIYMIEGELIIGDIILKPGDFHIAKAGKHHPVHRTMTGCICLITQAMDNA